MRFLLNIVLLPFLPFAMLLGATEALVRRLGPLGVVVRILSLPLWLLALPVALMKFDQRAETHGRIKLFPSVDLHFAPGPWTQGGQLGMTFSLPSGATLEFFRPLNFTELEDVLRHALQDGFPLPDSVTWAGVRVTTFSGATDVTVTYVAQCDGRCIPAQFKGTPEEEKLADALFASMRRVSTFPTTAALDALRQRVFEASERGNAALVEGQADVALREFLETQRLALEVAASHPSDPWVDHAMQVALYGGGRALLLQGKPDDAALCLQEALVVVERQLARAPDDGALLTQHFANHSKLGDARLAQGREAEATALFDTALASARRVVALDATDVRAQADVCTALEKLGHAAARRQDPVATVYFAEAHAVLSKVDELSPLSEPDQAWRTELARLARLS